MHRADDAHGYASAVGVQRARARTDRNDGCRRPATSDTFVGGRGVAEDRLLLETVRQRGAVQTERRQERVVGLEDVDDRRRR